MLKPIYLPELVDSLLFIYKAYTFEPFRLDGFIEIHNQQLKEGRYHNHDLLLWINAFDFLQQDGQFVRLRIEHQSFIDQVSQLSYPFSEAASLINSYIFKNREKKIYSMVGQILQLFTPRNGELKIQIKTIPYPSTEYSLIQLLIQTRIIIIRDNYYCISTECIDWVQPFFARKRAISADEFERILDYKKKLGYAAEIKCLEYEKKRLTKLGLQHLITNIQHIGILDVTEGYDILSYIDASSGIIPDMYIEVKATSDKEIKFYWTKNEIEKAKQYGALYWLYIVTEFNPDNLESGKININQDPYTTVYNSPNYSKSEELIYVKKKTDQEKDIRD
jgi:hypothetical protein